MAGEIQKLNGSAQMDPETMLMVVAGGDCARLPPEQKLAYYNARCEAAGLDPRAQPFAFMKLNGKEVLYALKTASDQLAAKHGIVLSIISQVTEDGIRVVTVRATAKDGRQTEEIGAVSVKGLQGDALCNALMKAVTKAKRRAVLSVAGLGMLDETEMETIPNAQQSAAQRPPVEEAKPTKAAENIQAAARTLDAEVLPPEPPKPEPTKKRSGPSPHALRVWNQAKARYGDDAKARFEAAAKVVFGATEKPSTEWDEIDANEVEDELFRTERVPEDVPF